MEETVSDKIIRVALRTETIPKWERISSHRRWTNTETADALADFYIEHNDDFKPVGVKSIDGSPLPAPDQGGGT